MEGGTSRYCVTVWYFHRNNSLKIPDFSACLSADGSITKCARCETPLIQHFFKNFWSSFNAEFYPESKSVRISKIRQILTILRIFFIHILRTYICREETNFSMKQLLNFITYWLIYYFNYWNLKFVIDSFKNFLLPSVQVIENHGMIVISVENVKVNKCFVIIH